MNNYSSAATTSAKWLGRYEKTLYELRSYQSGAETGGKDWGENAK